MMDGLAKISSAVRIFVTSRPEVHIEHALRSSPFVAPPDCPGFVHRLQRFRLHEISQDIVDSDIKLYFQKELHELHAGNLFGDRSTVDELTRLAAGLFIYATTMVQYIRSCAEDGSVPDIALHEHTAPKSALNKLGDLYAAILDRAPIGAPDPDKSLAAIKAVLRYIAVLQDHLSPNALIALSPIDLKDHIFPALRRLAPVLSFDPEQGHVPVRPLHASFVDFLLDPNCSRAEYRVWVPEQDLRLATATLGLLKDSETVTHYIRHVQKFPHLHSSTSNIVFGPSNVALDVMQYACIYWPAHVTHYLDSNILLALAQEPVSKLASESDIQRLIRGYQAVSSAFFVPAHIICWIEILAYLQRLNTVTEWLPTLHLVFSDFNKSLPDCLYGAYRLVLQFYPILVQDPRHLYISALPQCPSTSPLRTCIPHAAAVPRSLLPYPAWSVLVTHPTEQLPITAWNEEKYRWVVRPSPDGQWVAVALRSGFDRRGDIHLRDAATGIVLRTLHVHTSGLVDLGISSDSRFIASATRRGEICITDCSSGIPVALYYHTDGDVTRVTFRCEDSELVIVHTHRGYNLARPVHFLILHWDRAGPTERALWPQKESLGLPRDHHHHPEPWSISHNGRWGALWTTGDLLDLHSFDEVKLPFVHNASPVSPRRHTKAEICGSWLSDSSLVCSIPQENGCCLMVVDIGQDIKEIEKQPRCSLHTPYAVSRLEASANCSLVALYVLSSSGGRIFLWHPNGANIRLVKDAHNCDFCLSPHGDTLYLAVAEDSTWSVLPTSQSSIATAQPLHSSALKFSAARDTIMAATARPADDSGREVGILSRGFPSTSSTTAVVSQHYFDSTPDVERAYLTPDPQWMIFPNDDVVLSSKLGDTKIFPDRSRHSNRIRYPAHWWCASASPNLSRIVACSGFDPLTFVVWDTETASLLHAFRTPRPFRQTRTHLYPGCTEIIVTDALDIHYVMDHHSFAFRYSDWSTSDADKLRLLPQPKPGPVPGEWFQIGNDGWVTRSDGHPEVHLRGQDRLFWIPPSQRIVELWRGDQHLLAMVTEYDVIVLDLSDFDDDTKEQYVGPLQIENE